MKVLVLAESYPSEEKPYSLAYIHSRLLEYSRLNWDVDVLSFTCQSDYTFEGIRVYRNLKDVSKYDAVISHAPNIRNHFRFIFTNLREVKRLYLWIHGHEVMRVEKEYPTPYSWNRRDIWKKRLHVFYSPIKILILRLFIKHLLYKCDAKIVFVSEWMRSVFERNIFKIPDESCAIIPNPANSVFISRRYSRSSLNDSHLRALCIRPWDNSKYAVDMVVEFAQNNPLIDFDIYGDGKFPIHVKCPPNVKFIKRFFTQLEIPDLLDKYNFAILPTRLDAQGVMACEFASYGIPLLVNDIPIMKEMLSSFGNVIFLKDFSTSFPLTDLPKSSSFINEHKYSSENIAKSEMEFLHG